MRLGWFLLLLILPGVLPARAADEGPSAAEIFCQQYLASPNPEFTHFSALVAALEQASGCVQPAEVDPPDFRQKKAGAPRKKDFFRYWGPHAVMIQEKTGVPAALLLAQWAEETSWGTSNLYVTANNLSGHFCAARNEGKIFRYEITFGDYVRDMDVTCGGPTTQRNSRALIFASPVDSAWAHVYNLVQSPSRITTYPKLRAEAARALAAKEVGDWRKMIPELNVHYAPGQGYGRKLANHIESNRLENWAKVKLCDH